MRQANRRDEIAVWAMGRPVYAPARTP